MSGGGGRKGWWWGGGGVGAGLVASQKRSAGVLGSGVEDLPKAVVGFAAQQPRHSELAVETFREGRLEAEAEWACCGGPGHG